MIDKEAIEILDKHHSSGLSEDDLAWEYIRNRMQKMCDELRKLKNYSTYEIIED